MDNQSVTDLSYLREIAMGDEEIIKDTTKAFLEDTPKSLDKLTDYYADQQWDKLYKEAHRIKPSLKYLGMSRASELIIEIEKQARSRQISDDLGSKIQEFKTICSKALDELPEKLDAFDSPS